MPIVKTIGVAQADHLNVAEIEFAPDELQPFATLLRLADPAALERFQDSTFTRPFKVSRLIGEALSNRFYSALMNGGSQTYVRGLGLPIVRAAILSGPGPGADLPMPADLLTEVVVTRQEFTAHVTDVPAIVIGEQYVQDRPLSIDYQL